MKIMNKIFDSVREALRDKSYDLEDAQSYRAGENVEEMVGSKEGRWDGSQPEHIQMVGSTAIKNAKYDPKNGDMKVTFRSGSKEYLYPNVPKEVAEGWKGAASKGRYFHSSIKPYSINQ